MLHVITLIKTDELDLSYIVVLEVLGHHDSNVETRHLFQIFRYFTKCTSTAAVKKSPDQPQKSLRSSLDLKYGRNGGGDLPVTGGWLNSRLMMWRAAPRSLKGRRLKAVRKGKSSLNGLSLLG